MPRLRLYDKSAPQNAGGRRIEGILMSRADDRNVVAEVDRFIGAVGAGTLKPSETARQMRSLLEALCFNATVSNYDEQQILERGRIYVVCPMLRG